MSPGAALRRHGAGEIDLAPPTWITLHQLSRYPSVDALLGQLRGRDARFYETRLGKRSDDVRVAMWQGDAGYDTWDAEVAGERHRLVMAKGGFIFENTTGDY